MSRRSSFNSARGNRVEIGQKRRNARQTFEKNLQESGLEIEHEYRVVRFFWSYPTLPTAEILNGKNAQAWVSMVLYLKDK